jgi:hypothetical protein
VLATAPGAAGRRSQQHVLAVEQIEAHLRSTVDDALAVYLTLVLPEVYRTLVLERGWSPDRYEAWLATTLVRDLLR